MLNLGMWEIAILIVLALVVVGPERLPTMVRFLGRQYGKLQRASRELRRAFIIEADRVDAELRSKELRKKRDAAREKLREQMEKARQENTPIVPISQNQDDYVPFDADPDDPSHEGSNEEYVPFDADPAEQSLKDSSTKQTEMHSEENDVQKD